MGHYDDAIRLRPASAAISSRGRRISVAGLVVLCALCAWSALSATLPELSASASAATLTRGFVDDVWFDGTQNRVSPQRWIAKTAASGARLVQIEVDWVSVEPTRPKPHSKLRNPAGAQFNFSDLDHRVEEFQHSGLQPVFLVTDAPRWAEGRGGSAAEYATGGYEPNATAFGDLAAALAKRYSGSFPDPDHPGRRLPRVRYYQAWAEAALGAHLTPQWIRSRGQLLNVGANIYRTLLNAFYAGVKSVAPGDQVISSGFAPFGNGPYYELRQPVLQRTHPITFIENLLCLNAQLKQTCSNPSHLDVLADDPYELDFSPTTPAFSPLDMSAPDLGRLTPIVRAAARAGTLLPHNPKPLWVTEFSYESNPPNRQAESAITQARWLEESLYVFWRQGVSAVLWYLVRDQPPPYNINYASGVYFHNGRPKPALTAYRFPLVVMGDGKHLQIWGIAPGSGSIRVEHRTGARWQVVASFHRQAGQVFDGLISAGATGDYRALLGRSSSLVWAVPKTKP